VIFTFCLSPGNETLVISLSSFASLFNGVSNFNFIIIIIGSVTKVNWFFIIREIVCELTFF
jgi:hypothetical protein